jgi:fermentation-respiration switch protein FrsA (DUF1100 family)
MRFQLEVDGTPSGQIAKILDEHRYFVGRIESGGFFQYEDYFLDPQLADWLVQAMKINPEPPAWWRDNMLFDATANAAKLPCPVLMVHGESDYLIETHEVAGAHRAIRKTGKRDVDLKVFPGLNHRFVPVRSRQESYRGDKATVLTRSDTSYPIDTAVLKHLSDWIVAKASRAKNKK